MALSSEIVLHISASGLREYKKEGNRFELIIRGSANCAPFGIAGLIARSGRTTRYDRSGMGDEWTS